MLKSKKQGHNINGNSMCKIKTKFNSDHKFACETIFFQ